MLRLLDSELTWTTNTKRLESKKSCACCTPSHTAGNDKVKKNLVDIVRMYNIQ